MSPFEFVFALFGLLFGLCIAEVFGGLGRAFEARSRRSIGWLTPMLGVFVIVDLLSAWSALWESRAKIPMNPLVLLAGALWAGFYYLAAYVVFPRDMTGEGNLDRHFFSVRRLVLGISAATFLIVALGELLLARIGTPADFAITAALFVPIYLTAFITKRERGAGAAVALLICLNVAGAVTHAVNLPG